MTLRDRSKPLALYTSVILINGHAERRWTAPNNEMLARMHHEFPKTRLVDWNAFAAGRPAFVGEAGLPSTLEGMLAFSARITPTNAAAPLQGPASVPGKSRRDAHYALGPDGKGADAKHALAGG